MKPSNLQSTLALGSLTATVALLAGLSAASAQSAPGGGSFPQSFLVPGTNTSLSVYGAIKAGFRDNIGAQATSNAGAPAGAGSIAFQTSQLALQGPGAGGGATGSAPAQNSIHGGFNGYEGPSTLTFETRTPSDLGEIKTVLAMDMNLLPNQGNYSTSTTTQSINPRVGQGNTDVPRLLWAYGTIGPWLIGQYNSAFADATLYPDVTDSGFSPGMVTTANARQPQLRYTFLAGNGVSLSASVEEAEDGTIYLGSTTGASSTAMTSAAVSTVASDHTDIGGVTNLPSFNTGVAWDQPWGHLMGRVGVNRNEIRNTLLGVQIMNPTGTLGAGSDNGSNNIKKWGYAVEAGGYLNTWGQDQWKFIVNYDKGVANYSTDLSPNNTGSMFCNGYTGQCSLISDLGIGTNYTHRFNPNWRTTAAFGMGFFSKPSAASGLTNVTSATGGAAQLASFEKRHLDSQVNVVYSPVPGLTDIYLEWDHWDRWVQASNTSGTSNAYIVQVNFYW